MLTYSLCKLEIQVNLFTWGLVEPSKVNSYKPVQDSGVAVSEGGVRG